jgi:hypothetical protein
MPSRFILSSSRESLAASAEKESINSPMPAMKVSSSRLVDSTRSSERMMRSLMWATVSLTVAMAAFLAVSICWVIRTC